MSTLYISDLDGTLFNREKKISSYTASVLNSCIKKGMKFAVATARMPYGCDYRLKEINLNTPGILTNGVFLYDFQEKKIIDAEIINSSSACDVIDIFSENNLPCFVYTYDEMGISIYYNDQKLENQTQYYSDRALEECKTVDLVENIKETVKHKKVVYITYTGEKEMLEPICDQLEQVKDINYSFYLNIYNGLYCLEIFSRNASKKNALIKLKNLMKSDELVIFGDNLNDLSMIEIADRSYAPKNALDSIKEEVNGILDVCDHDGVAKFLEREFSEN